MNDRVEEIENTWIPLADGCRLAARLWLPASAWGAPVPALLEFLPYRKRDFMRSRDEPMHRWFAQQGYACARVDLRGSGDSDGLLEDEYSLQEHVDGEAVVAWLAEQPWCDGNVGMFGISWGGFNALQVAARRPPALKAIISLCASDDRYSDDAHFMGGCLLTENLQWGAIFMLNQALPPDPLLVGEGWRESWRARLEALPNFPAQWLAHPWRDDYWVAGSVADHIDRINVPVFAIGGWADGYSNAVPRLLASLRVPCKGLIGPWAHNFPHLGRPGPAIGFLQEAKRWWDRWLRGMDNGVDADPALRVWMQEHVTPAPQYDTWPGRWVAEPTWPSPRIQPRRYYLTAGGLAAVPGEAEARILASPQHCGLRGGEWCAFGADGEMPRDQRPDDGLSLVFDSSRLRERVEILGAPRLRLALRSDQPVAHLVARLCDVAPDGTSLRVSYGVLNLCHRSGHREPEPLQPGETVLVELQLNDAAHAFPVGHRIRVALSTTYWPIIWPAPAPATLKIVTGRSRLELPVRPPRVADQRLRSFPEPVMAPAPTVKRVRHHSFQRRLAVDLTADSYHYELAGSEFADASMVYLEDIDLQVGYTLNKYFDITGDDPLSACERIEQRASLARGDWRITASLEMTMRCDVEAFHIEGKLRTTEGGESFVERSWNLDLPRELL